MACPSAQNPPGIAVSLGSATQIERFYRASEIIVLSCSGSPIRSRRSRRRSSREKRKLQLRAGRVRTTFYVLVLSSSLSPALPLPPRSLSLPLLFSRFVRCLFLVLSLLFFSACASARESYGGTYERAFITCVYVRYTRTHARTLSHGLFADASPARSSLSANGGRTSVSAGLRN